MPSSPCEHVCFDQERVVEASFGRRLKTKVTIENINSENSTTRNKKASFLILVTSLK